MFECTVALFLNQFLFLFFVPAGNLGDTVGDIDFDDLGPENPNCNKWSKMKFIRMKIIQNTSNLHFWNEIEL